MNCITIAVRKRSDADFPVGTYFHCAYGLKQMFEDDR